MQLTDHGKIYMQDIFYGAMHRFEQHVASSIKNSVSTLDTLIGKYAPLDPSITQLRYGLNQFDRNPNSLINDQYWLTRRINNDKVPEKYQSSSRLADATLLSYVPIKL